jgi:hypothetical protein
LQAVTHATQQSRHWTCCTGSFKAAAWAASGRSFNSKPCRALPVDRWEGGNSLISIFHSRDELTARGYHSFHVHTGLCTITISQCKCSKNRM